MAIYVQVMHLSIVNCTACSYDLLQVIFAMAFERIFFNTLPNWLSLLGTVIILSSAVYVVVSVNTVDHVLRISC